MCTNSFECTIILGTISNFSLIYYLFICMTFVLKTKYITINNYFFAFSESVCS